MVAAFYTNLGGLNFRLCAKYGVETREWLNYIESFGCCEACAAQRERENLIILSSQNICHPLPIGPLNRHTIGEMRVHNREYVIRREIEVSTRDTDAGVPHRKELVKLLRIMKVTAFCATQRGSATSALLYFAISDWRNFPK